jgi:hypothetical protein
MRGSTAASSRPAAIPTIAAATVSRRLGGGSGVAAAVS